MSKPVHRLLLLDEDSQYLANLFDALAGGYEVFVLNDAREALERVPLYTPDLVVTEMELGGMDGLKFVRSLHRLHGLQDLPVVFLSRRDSPADVKLGEMVKAVKYISKKIDVPRVAAELAGVIRSVPVRVRHKKMTIQEVYDDLQQEARARHLATQEARARRSMHVGIEFRQAEEPAPPPPGAPGPVVHRIRLLIGEEEVSTIAWIEAQVRTFCDCIGARSGVEAVDKAGLYLPDVVLVNLRLPNLPGFEVSQTLRGHPLFKGNPIFGMAHASDALMRTDPTRFGMNRIFSVPDDIDSLISDLEGIARDPCFACHKYKQRFVEVLAAEEAERVKLERMEAEHKNLQRRRDFTSFFHEYDEGG